MENVVEEYRLDLQFNIDVKVTYKGVRVGADFMEKNPEIAKKYISKAEFSRIYNTLKAKTSIGMRSLIEVTENGVTPHLDKDKL